MWNSLVFETHHLTVWLIFFSVCVCGPSPPFVGCGPSERALFGRCTFRFTYFLIVARRSIKVPPMRSEPMGSLFHALGAVGELNFCCCHGCFFFFIFGEIIFLATWTGRATPEGAGRVDSADAAARRGAVEYGQPTRQSVTRWVVVPFCFVIFKENIKKKKQTRSILVRLWWNRGRIEGNFVLPTSHRLHGSSLWRVHWSRCLDCFANIICLIIWASLELTFRLWQSTSSGNRTVMMILSTGSDIYWLAMLMANKWFFPPLFRMWVTSDLLFAENGSRVCLTYNCGLFALAPTRFPRRFFFEAKRRKKRPMWLSVETKTC